MNLITMRRALAVSSVALPVALIAPTAALAAPAPQAAAPKRAAAASPFAAVSVTQYALTKCEAPTYSGNQERVVCNNVGGNFALDSANVQIKGLSDADSRNYTIQVDTGAQNNTNLSAYNLDWSHYPDHVVKNLGAGGTATFNAPKDVNAWNWSVGVDGPWVMPANPVSTVVFTITYNG